MSNAAEAVIAALAAVGAQTCEGEYQVTYDTLNLAERTDIHIVGAEEARRNPLVSCLMVTRGEVAQIAFAVKSYQAQTWPNRELVVAAPRDAVSAIEALLRQMGVARFSVHAADQGLTLGDLRNFVIARAQGDVLMQWDDDDLHDPLRVALTTAVLVKSGAAMAYLTRWLLWWPARRIAAISSRHLHEGSLAVWRDHAPVYPALACGEDSRACEQIFRTRKVVSFDAPLQYLYAIHGRNTWDEAHFEEQIGKADRIFRDDEFEGLNEVLSPRMPVIEYAAYLRKRAAGPAP